MSFTALRSCRIRKWTLCRRVKLLGNIKSANMAADLCLFCAVANIWGGLPTMLEWRFSVLHVVLLKACVCAQSIVSKGFGRQFSRLLYQSHVFLCPRCRCVTVVKGKVTNLFAIRTLRCSNPLGKSTGMSEVYLRANRIPDRNNSCNPCSHEHSE